jgi:fatty-acyl-CoA synthase
MGEEVGAFIRLRQNETADEDSIRLFCRENLSRHKVPKFIRFVQSFPLTASGKGEEIRIA